MPKSSPVRSYTVTFDYRRHLPLEEEPDIHEHKQENIQRFLDSKTQPRIWEGHRVAKIWGWWATSLPAFLLTHDQSVLSDDEEKCIVDELIEHAIDHRNYARARAELDLMFPAERPKRGRPPKNKQPPDSELPVAVAANTKRLLPKKIHFPRRRTKSGYAGRMLRDGVWYYRGEFLEKLIPHLTCVDYGRSLLSLCVCMDKYEEKDSTLLFNALELRRRTTVRSVRPDSRRWTDIEDAAIRKLFRPLEYAPKVPLYGPFEKNSSKTEAFFCPVGHHFPLSDAVWKSIMRNKDELSPLEAVHVLRDESLSVELNKQQILRRVEQLNQALISTLKPTNDAISPDTQVRWERESLGEYDTRIVVDKNGKVRRSSRIPLYGFADLHLDTLAAIAAEELL